MKRQRIYISKYLCTSMNNCTEANVQCVYGGYMRVREVVALYFPLVLIFSKQCTGKQEQDLFSLSLNEILVHTWVLNARESIFSILLYVCSQNLSVENSYTNTQYGNTNNVALRITWFEFSIYHTQQKFPNIYHLVYTQVGNYSNCLERKYKQYEFSFSRINVLLKCNIHR